MSFGSLKGWKRLAATASAAWLLGATPTIHADDNPDLKVLLQRLDRLEKENKELHRRLDELAPVSEPDQTVPASGAVAPPAPGAADYRKFVDDYLNEKEARAKEVEARKKKDLEENGSTVGDNLGLTYKWDHGPWAESADKAFRFHFTGRTQVDWVGYQAGEAVQFGNNGVGRVDEGLAFRRARLGVEGTLWEVFDFNVEFDFTNTDTLAQNFALDRTDAGAVANVRRIGRVEDTPVPTDIWTQVRLPWFTLRMGNLKPAISFEHNTSSRFLNFLERSYGFDAFIGGADNGFSPGLLAFRNFADDRIHFSTSLTKFNQTIFGFNTGDGDWQYCARTGFFPVYDSDGRCAVWVGCGYRHNDSDFIATGNRQFTREGDGQVRLRARTLLRNGPAELHTPLLDSFPFASSQDLIVPEFAAVFGPLTVQAEYSGSWLHDARALPDDPRGVTQFTQAGYVEVLYFLTGENRVFNRVLPGFARVVPYENAWAVKNADGSLNTGRGAWQVGVRYSWVDLADQNVLGGNSTIGSAQGVTLGLNWFLNPNMKFQWNYTYEQRYQINQVAEDSPTAGLFPHLPSDGELHGFGMRLAFDF